MIPLLLTAQAKLLMVMGGGFGAAALILLGVVFMLLTQRWVRPRRIRKARQ